MSRVVRLYGGAGRGAVGDAVVTGGAETGGVVGDAVVGAAVVGGGAVGTVGARRQRPPDDGPGTFLAAVTDVASILRSGASPEAAWRRGLAVRVVDGAPLWSDLEARWPDDLATARAVHAVARLSTELGAAPALLLDEVGAALVQEAEARAERQAALAGPRTTVRVLAWLPLLGLLLGAALGADPWTVLLDGGAGSGLLLAGAALTWAGRRWTHRYLRAAEAAGREQ